MKDTTDNQPNAFAEWWDDLEPGEKFSTVWLSLVFIGLVIVGITFPVAGLIMLGLVVVMVTIGVLVYLWENSY
jgi:hypothetical protein